MALEKQLAAAAASGDLAQVRELAARDPEAVAHWKPIMDAAYRGRAKVAAALIEAGADPNVVSGTADRHRPLDRCLERKATFPRGPEHLETARVLIEYGADVEAVGGRNRWTLLAHAAFGGDPQFVDLLLGSGAKVDGFGAAMLYDRRRLRAALKRDPGLPKATDETGRTPLHWAAASGMFRTLRNGAKRSCEVAELLLEAGADVDVSYAIPEGDEVFHVTPLWWATGWQQNVELIRFLLARGADPEGAIFTATFEGSAAILECFEQTGVNLDIEFEGRTPLLDLLHYRRPRAVRWLLEQGANPDAKDPNGRTALHLAALAGTRSDVLELLLEHGACLNAKDRDGRTPLTLAREARKKRVVRFLESRRAQV